MGGGGCLCVSVCVRSVSAQDGIVALGKAHTRSAPSLSSLPKVTPETVPIFAWLNIDRSRPWREECWPLCARACVVLHPYCVKLPPLNK